MDCHRPSVSIWALATQPSMPAPAVPSHCLPPSRIKSPCQHHPSSKRLHPKRSTPCHPPTVTRGCSCRMSRPLSLLSMRSRIARSGSSPVVSPAAATRSPRRGSLKAPSSEKSPTAPFCTALSGMWVGYCTSGLHPATPGRADGGCACLFCGAFVLWPQLVAGVERGKPLPTPQRRGSKVSRSAELCEHGSWGLSPYKDASGSVQEGGQGLEGAGGVCGQHSCSCKQRQLKRRLITRPLQIAGTLISS